MMKYKVTQQQTIVHYLTSGISTICLIHRTKHQGQAPNHIPAKHPPDRLSSLKTQVAYSRMAYRYLPPPSESIEQTTCSLELGIFTYTPLFQQYETSRALETSLSANALYYAERFFYTYGYWPSFEDPLRELHQPGRIDQHHRMPRLIDVRGIQGVWIVPRSDIHLCITLSLLKLNPLSLVGIGRGQHFDALFLTGSLTHRELSALHEGDFPGSLRRIGMPGYNFRAGMISGGESISNSLVSVVEYVNFVDGFSSFTGRDAGFRQPQQQGESSRINTRNANQREGSQQHNPPTQDRPTRHEQDEDDNEDEYEINDQPHRPQRRNTCCPATGLGDNVDLEPQSNIHWPHHTDDELMTKKNFDLREPLFVPEALADPHQEVATAAPTTPTTNSTAKDTFTLIEPLPVHVAPVVLTTAITNPAATGDCDLPVRHVLSAAVAQAGPHNPKSPGTRAHLP